MKISLDKGERQFLQRLHQLGSASVQEICDDLGVTATAIRQRLSRLAVLDFVCRDVVRSGRGRPHHTYRVTEAGRRILGDNYVDLALILWRELQEIGQPGLREKIFGRIRSAMVEHFGKAVEGSTLEEKLDQLRAILDERGFDVEVDFQNGTPILRENNCPYLELAGNDRAICELEQEVYREVLGADVKLTQCCLDGHSCCEFQAVELQ